jgi:hypothetical protein
MNNLQTSFFISVYAPSCTVSFNFFSLAEKNELALSFNGRLCSIFSDSLAFFDTEELANDFLKTVNLKPYWSYSVHQIYFQYK